MKFRLVKNKKGVSSAFIAVYLALLAVLLISTLFVALYTYGSAVTERMKMEEERQQESIGLAGPEALRLNGDKTIVEELRVNNTGTITVRIRGLYIDSKFVCDPSRLTNDSYINPKGCLWIKLSPLPGGIMLYWNETTINADWTVTTERGVTAHEIGAYLYYKKTEPGSNPMRFYIGPLMIMFDMFHWRSGTGPWRSGWSIPKNTPDVTWRILISNVDNRDIEVTEKSSLTLICNDNSPKDPKPWYIDPTSSSTYYKPSYFYFVYYSFSKPVSEGGSSRQSTSGFSEYTTWITFLQFLGSFVEPNGTRTPYGQTIPFEAVLATGGSMPNSMTLAANPQNIRNDGLSTSTITAVVYIDESRNVRVPDGTWVDFYTTAGIFSDTHTTTTHANTTNGVATAILISSAKRQGEVAFIVALSQGTEAATKVGFTPATQIKVSAKPATVSRDKGSSVITVWLANGTSNITQPGIQVTITVLDNNRNPVSGRNAPILEYDIQQSQQITVTMNSNGQATLAFKTRGMNKPSFIITADDGPNGLQGSEVIITITR